MASCYKFSLCSNIYMCAKISENFLRYMKIYGWISTLCFPCVLFCRFSLFSIYFLFSMKFITKPKTKHKELKCCRDDFAISVKIQQFIIFNLLHTYICKILVVKKKTFLCLNSPPLLSLYSLPTPHRPSEKKLPYRIFCVFNKFSSFSISLSEFVAECPPIDYYY